jgi:hypothetical protein
MLAEDPIALDNIYVLKYFQILIYFISLDMRTICLVCSETSQCGKLGLHRHIHSSCSEILSRNVVCFNITCKIQLPHGSMLNIEHWTFIQIVHSLPPSLMTQLCPHPLPLLTPLCFRLCLPPSPHTHTLAFVSRHPHPRRLRPWPHFWRGLVTRYVVPSFIHPGCSRTGGPHTSTHACWMPMCMHTLEAHW